MDLICEPNFIKLMPLRVKHLQGSCDNPDSNLRFKLILAAQWINETSNLCQNYKAYYSLTVRTFSNEDWHPYSALSTAKGQFVVNNPDEGGPGAEWELHGIKYQLVSVSPYYLMGDKRVEGIPVPNVGNKDVWVVVDFAAPRTWFRTGGYGNWPEQDYGPWGGLWGGNCWCQNLGTPCACPGMYPCGENPGDNVNQFLNSPQGIYPWEAPTGDNTDSCCTGCSDPFEIPSTRDYVDCEAMYKGPSACPGNPLPDTTLPYWSHSYLYKCGKSFNFWIKAHNYG